MQIDAAFKIPEIIRYGDDLVRRWRVDLSCGQNTHALAEKCTFPAAAPTRLEQALTTVKEPLRDREVLLDYSV